MYELCIHEPSSELVKITQISCGDSDIYIYFKTLFFLNMCLCVHAHNYVAVHSIPVKVEVTLSFFVSHFASLLCLSCFLPQTLSVPFQLLCGYHAVLYSKINRCTKVHIYTCTQRSQSHDWMCKYQSASLSIVFYTVMHVYIFLTSVQVFEAEWENRMWNVYNVQHVQQYKTQPSNKARFQRSLCHFGCVY